MAGTPSPDPRRRNAVMLAVAVAVTGVLVGTAVLTRSDTGADDAATSSPGAGTPPGTRPAATTTTQHQPSQTWTGPIWMTLETSEPGTHSVQLRWGPTTRRFAVTGGTPATYTFLKKDAAGPSISVASDFPVTVTFGEGRPAHAEDVNGKGWTTG